ncbi:glycerol acyltransferase [Pontibacillus yanchengensis]|uniref:Glycerol acyltransferase n=2 Tax=Pontibacillus yanchengensis TaxID=462910 RepID=A0ACC7VCA9_9BACI|nr:lysophospholipid acyltransferase family protein [Pontibacillus yanchengensis]MYL34784.1 glycerol acyltransferase [Pontibacillus yanchengensis]MYL52230.1 glycerol acyltransferase [Pontibacillus yanchengensis]
MIPANKSRFWEKGFDFFVKRLARFHFQNVYINGAPPSSSKRTLFLVNHSAWWDPIIIFLLNQHIFHGESYAMMHEEGIKKVPIFRRLGAFSINRNNPKDILNSLKYASEQLNHGHNVWIFPQGDEQHLEKRPLEFSNGAAYITEKTKEVQVIPIAIYYTFQSTRKAYVYISIGESIFPSHYNHLKKEARTQFFEEHCTTLLDQLKQRIILNKTDSFRRFY